MNKTGVARLAFAVANLAVLSLLLARTNAPQQVRALPTPPRPAAYFFPQVGVAKYTLKGVANVSSCADVESLGARWQYSWGPKPELCDTTEDVPMVWGKEIPSVVEGDSDWLMGQNECDLPDQCNATPAEIAAVWPQMERFGARLVAPVPSQLHPEWLMQFVHEYALLYGRAPRLDALAVHCYFWTASECIALLEQYKRWAIGYGAREVWLSEFAFSPCEDRSMKQAGEQTTALVNWIKGEPMITRYAYFTTRIHAGAWWMPKTYWCGSPGLMDAEAGLLNFFGQLYRTY